MKNVQIADNQVETLRRILLKGGNVKEYSISIEDMLGTLSCLERLSVIERHLHNLVSVAYEEEEVVNDQPNV